MALGLAGCSDSDSWAPTPDEGPTARAARVGVVSLFGNEFLAVKMLYLSQYNSWTSEAPDWALDDYITRLARDSIVASGKEYVDLQYDRTALARAYNPTQNLSEIQSALVDTFSFGMSESPVRYFDVDAVELDLRALCRIKALDEMILVTRGRHKILAGAGLVHSDTGDDTRFFAILDFTVFDCPGPRETDWDNVRTAQPVESRMWVNKLEKLPPEGRKAFETEVKALLAKSLEQAMIQTGMARPGAGATNPDGLDGLDYAAAPDDPEAGSADQP